MRTLLISAAEPSGDRLAGELVEALRGLCDDLRFLGVAGPRMRAAGVEPIARAEDLAVMGAAELLGHLTVIARIKRQATAALTDDVDALVVIDAPDLHLPLARTARARGITAIGYVSPQVWAWRPGRVEAIARDLDHLLCLFAFEPPLYAEAAERHETAVSWVGHPVVDRLPARGAVDPALYGLLPGSRGQEIERLLEPFLAAAELIRAARPEARFALPAPPDIRDGLPELPPFVTVVDGVPDLAAARAALTKSGTVTLELAVMGVPMVVAHRVHPLTWWLGRRLVRGVNHLALPNILADREVVPEFVQDFTPEALAETVLGLRKQQALDLSALGGPGASRRAAEAVLEIL